MASTKKGFTFAARLNPNNTDDAHLISIHEKWRKAGKTDREILGMGLLALEGRDIPKTTSAAMRKFHELLSRMEDVLNRANTGQYTPTPEDTDMFGDLSDLFHGLPSARFDDSEDDTQS